MYASCCEHHAVNLSADDATPQGYQKYIDGLIQQLYDAEQTPDTDPVLIRAYGEKLNEAVVDGFGSTLKDIAWNAPEYPVLTALENNVWQFSAAKAFTQVQNMAEALVGADGKIKSFEEFRRDAQQIAGQQLNWLRAEYDTAIASGQMAAKWQTIQAQKEALPLLEFDAVIDDRTSSICRPLNKVIRPVDDAFWKMYYPPNHFNCRSTVRQLREGEITPVKHIQYPEKVPDGFKTNVGIDNKVFPEDSDYYKGTPAYIVNNATLYMPQEEQYIVKYEAEDGTQLLANRQTDIKAGEDYDDLLKVGEALADQGITSHILPVIHTSEDELRAELLPGVKEDKNPDMNIDGEYYEVKTPTDPITYAKLQKNVADAAQQADRVIVLLDQEYSTDLLQKVAEERFRTFPDLQEIGFVTSDGEYLEFQRDKNK